MKYRIIKTREGKYLPQYFGCMWKPIATRCDEHDTPVEYDTFEEAKSACLDGRLDVTEFNDDPIDWNAKLIELSGLAMQGILINPAEYPNVKDPETAAKESICIANELIKQLKEEIK